MPFLFFIAIVGLINLTLLGALVVYLLGLFFEIVGELSDEFAAWVAGKRRKVI